MIFNRINSYTYCLLNHISQNHSVAYTNKKKKKNFKCERVKQKVGMHSASTCGLYGGAVNAKLLHTEKLEF